MPSWLLQAKQNFCQSSTTAYPLSEERHENRGKQLSIHTSLPSLQRVINKRSPILILTLSELFISNRRFARRHRRRCILELQTYRFLLSNSEQCRAKLLNDRTRITRDNRILQTLQTYIFGRQFLIEMEHKHLVWRFSLKDPSSRLVTWRLKLEEFQYKVLYKKR